MHDEISLADAVIASLGRDPRIADPAEIAVSAKRGVVTLRGTVESFSQRKAAAEDARAVDGVDDVDDKLEVELMSSRKEDYVLRGQALQALAWDTAVPADDLDVNVHNGWLTLRGNVKHQYQSDAAYEDVASVPGVVDVTNEIRVNAR